MLDAELEQMEPARYRAVLDGRRSLGTLYDRTIGRLGPKADQREEGRSP